MRECTRPIRKKLCLEQRAIYCGFFHMQALFRLAPLALVAYPSFSHAQERGGSTVGLEIPASPPPASEHWPAGAYVTGSYTPVLAPGLAGYGV